MGLADADNDSVTSEQFQDYLTSMEPGMKKDIFNVDFAKEFTTGKQKKKGKREEDDDRESDEDFQFDDEEMNDAFKEFDDLAEEGKRTEFGEEELDVDDDDFPSPESDNEAGSIGEDSDDDDEVQPIVKRKKKQSKYAWTLLFLFLFCYSFICWYYDLTLYPILITHSSPWWQVHLIS